MPLRARPPTWLTPELLAAADEGPVAVPTAVADDLPVSGLIGIRPGSWMVSPSGCTMNFVFGSPGAYAIGTAGHCVKAVGDEVHLVTVAPAGDDVGQWVVVRLGRVVVRHDNGVGDDFALVAIDPRYQSWVSPTMAQLLGPCNGTVGDRSQTARIEGWNPLSQGEQPIAAGEALFHHGHGAAVGTGGTSRAGVATAWTPSAYYWVGAAAPGDSGSATRALDLRAAGNLTHLVIDSRVPGLVAGTRAPVMEAIASLPIAMSPLCG